jgi:hypothetical protein
MSRARPSRFWVVLVVAACLVASRAAADDVELRKVGLGTQEDELLVSFGYTDIFDVQSRANLQNGLPTTILLRMTLTEAKAKTPLSFTLRNASITYDLWDEVYHVVIQRPGQKKKKKHVVEKASEAIDLAAKVKKHPISIEDVPPGSYRLRMIVDRNPVSKEVLKGMRNWLNRPAGSSGRLRPGDSFFGSFISFFINKKLQKAEETMELKSQKFSL